MTKRQGRDLYGLSSYEAYLEQCERKVTFAASKRQRRAALFNKLQEAFGCHHCGLKDHRYLTWNHVDPSEKSKLVTHLYHYSFPVVLAEMRKCNVLCTACHQEETQRQRRLNKLVSSPQSRLSREEWETGRAEYLRTHNITPRRKKNYVRMALEPQPSTEN